ncbi:MAG: Gfo/Idh/MocA family oxidoreductase [Firmicutes bacterium]|nr:Gfo/Idh/MocA family oxidoreductase [Bacillota bacterium]
MNNLRAGIIGCGNIFTMHATSVANLDGVELAAVCDVKPERLAYARQTYPAAAYTDYKEMIRREKLDAVHICTPHYLHTEMARFAFENGVHVLSEKPMSIGLKDAEECVALAEQKGLCYGVIFQCRYNTASQLVKKYLDNGTLGHIISARVVLTWHRPDSYYALSDWKGTPDKEGGGVVIDQAIHSLDLANWFIQSKPVKIEASLNNRNHKIMTVEDSAEGMIWYENGAILGFWTMNSYGCDEPIEIRLFCEKGKAVLSYDEAVVTLNSGEVISAKQQAEKIRYKDGKEYWGFQHIKQIGQFYDAVVRKEEPEISGREALKIQKIITKIYKRQ